MAFGVIVQKVIDRWRRKLYISAMLATRISERKRNDFTALSRNAWGFFIAKNNPQTTAKLFGDFSLTIETE
ncbi:hypothetical protein Q7453_11310 [Glaesserella parasuis]|nr:hypothetical protein [Glaesserella parasuis]MDO9858917.1 hypothetical protein [Glaesserella parasuis]MDO9896835.1 hypothetical protein [Glaesserella parasuis]MDO9984695.1 hypothetical protein [Glaesserella parasuis]